MKYFALSMISALALASLGTEAVARPIPQSQAQAQDQPGSQVQPSGQQSSQTGSAGGYAGNASETQNNDYSHVAPGNQVSNGGSQSASLQGLAGSILQNSNIASLLQRRQDSQDASAGGYAGSSNSFQNNDPSQVAPGNQVQFGGSQSASDQGISGTVDQLTNLGQLSKQKRMVRELPAKMVARASDNNHNDVYLDHTNFGPGPVVQGPAQDSCQGQEHCLPRYMGLGPEVTPATPLWQ